MERYIAEANVYKLVEPMGTARVHCSQIDELPRADVVPRNEIARELFEEIDQLFERFYNDPFYTSGDLGYDIDELKKKYTEGS